MRWSSPMLSKMEVVRRMRLQVAELALTRAERTLGGLREAEARQRDAQANTERRSAEAACDADAQLVRHTTGGRAGISQWAADRQQAKAAVQTAVVRVGDAVAARDRQLEVCAQARSHWRARRFDVERLKLLAEAARKAAR
jgi:hypothetical protein